MVCLYVQYVNDRVISAETLDKLTTRLNDRKVYKEEKGLCVNMKKTQIVHMCSGTGHDTVDDWHVDPPKWSWEW